MFFFGLLAVLQMTLLPGLIVVFFLKLKMPFFFKLGAVFITSLLVNFLLIFLLVVMHIYTRSVMLAWIALELLALAWLYRQDLKSTLNQSAGTISTRVKTFWEHLVAIFTDPRFSGFASLVRNLVIAAFVALAASLIWWFFRRFTNNLGTVFNHWDAVVSWNFWAQAWAQGQFPDVHLLYPQLIPINLSIPYLLTGDFQVSFFSKSVMPLFSLLMVLVVFELGVRKKKYGYFIAVLLIYLLLKKFLGEYISEGYVDIPVAFMSLMALIPFLMSDDFLDDWKAMIPSFLFALAASVTKQVGFYILCILPILGLLGGKLSKPKVRRLLWIFGISVLLAVPWYIPRIVEVLNNSRATGLAGAVAHSTDVYDSQGFLSLIVQAFGSLSKYQLLYLLLLPALFLLKKPFKLVILLVIIPYSLFWAAVASYDFRNLALVLPLLAVVSGLCTAEIIDLGLVVLNKIKVGGLPSAVYPILIILVMILLGILYPAQRLKTTWVEKQKQIFSPEINEQVYKLEFSRECQYILTNYPVSFLPGLENNQVDFYFDDVGVYEKYLQDESICWMLVPGYATENINQAIENSLEEGSFELLFSTKKWVPYRLIRIR